MPRTRASQALENALRQFGFVHVAGADGSHHGQPAHGVQSGADYTAMDTVEGIVAHQLRTHVDARHHPLWRDSSDLQAQDLVKGDALLKDFLESRDELFFEYNRGS